MIRKMQAAAIYRTLLLCLPLLLLFPQLSWAHATIVESSPAANEVLDKPPSRVIITFNEPLQKAFMLIQVTNERGKRTDTGEARLDPSNPAIMEISLLPDMKDGVYSINWRALSADGHPVKGVIPFQVGSTSAQFEDAGTATDNSAGTRPDLMVVRWLLYIGLSLLLGTLCFRMCLVPEARNGKGAHSPDNGQSEISPGTTMPRYASLLWTGYGITAAAVMFTLPLQASWDAGVPWNQALSPGILGEALQYTDAGIIWFIQIVLILVLSVTLLYALDRQLTVDRRRWWGYASVTLVLGIMLAKSFTGHPAASAYKLLSVTADFVHLVAASFWIGSLAAMVLCLPAIVRPLAVHERTAMQQSTLRRFAAWGVTSVAALVATGIYGAVLYVPSWGALLTTSYGLVLLGKTVLLLFMLLFAARQFRSARQQTASSGAHRGLRMEFTTGLIVMLLAAVLTHLSPGQAPVEPFQETRTTSTHSVTLSISPAIVGSNSIGVWIKDTAGASVKDIQQVTLTLTSTNPGLNSQELVLQGNTQQPFQAKELIAAPGTWTVHVHALTASLDAIDAEFTVTVGGG